MRDDFSGKTVLVTGAAQGIGFAIARAFLEAGASVLLTDRLEAEGEQAAQTLGGQAGFFRHDVSVDEDWAGAVAEAERRFGGLDIFVNNAGIETVALMTEIDPADFRRLFDVNVLGVMLGTKHAFRAMRPGGSSGRGGAIVNIASAAAIMQTAGLSIYSASKAAVAHFTRNAAIEAAALGHGVRSNCIMPGMTETGMARKVGEDFAALGLVESEPSMRSGALLRLPMRRYAEPREIASVAVFLASDAASYMTGACLPVEGAAALLA